MALLFCECLSCGLSLFFNVFWQNFTIDLSSPNSLRNFFQVSNKEILGTNWGTSDWQERRHLKFSVSGVHCRKFLFSIVSLQLAKRQSAFRSSVVEQNQRNHHSQSKERKILLKSQWELKVRTTKPPKARESAGDQVVIGFSFASYWLRGWCNFSGPITKRSKEKPMQSRITFDARLKIALLSEWSKKATRSLLFLSWCIRQNIKCVLSLSMMSK